MGMQLEAQEKLDEAADYYEYILSLDQTNLVLHVYPLNLRLDGLETSSCSPSFNKETS
jgi:hypothetical protein